MLFFFFAMRITSLIVFADYITGDDIKLIFVTSNPHKFREAQEILKPYKIRLERLAQSYPEIRAEDVGEVARESAESLFARLKRPLITEDSGLFIPSLNNFPGVYSAWVQKKLGNKGILKLMEGETKREAFFKSCIAYADAKITKIFCGEVHGAISWREAGSQGFGYDPIFIPKNEKITFAESETLKKGLSHRSNAFTAFAKWYSNYITRKA